MKLAQESEGKLSKEGKPEEITNAVCFLNHVKQG